MLGKKFPFSSDFAVGVLPIYSYCSAVICGRVFVAFAFEQGDWIFRGSVLLVQEKPIAMPLGLEVVCITELCTRTLRAFVILLASTPQICISSGVKNCLYPFRIVACLRWAFLFIFTQFVYCSKKTVTRCRVSHAMERLNTRRSRQVPSGKRSRPLQTSSYFELVKLIRCDCFRKMMF